MSLVTRLIPNDGEGFREPASGAIGGIVEFRASTACVSGLVFVGDGDRFF